MLSWTSTSLSLSCTAPTRLLSFTKLARRLSLRCGLRRRIGMSTSTSEPPPCSREPLSADVDRRSKRDEELTGECGVRSERVDADAVLIASAAGVSARRNGKDDAAF